MADKNNTKKGAPVEDKNSAGAKAETTDTGLVSALQAQTEVLEEQVNKLTEANEAMSAEIKELKAASKPSSKSKANPDRVISIGKKKYRLKLQKARDAAGTVDFRDLKDGEVAELYERFQTIFEEV